MQRTNAETAGPHAAAARSADSISDLGVSRNGDVPNARHIAGFVCRTTASVAAFIEHGYQESLTLVEQHQAVVIAIAQALIGHPKRTLNAPEIDAVIAPVVGVPSRSR
jgi:hypothetical protein